MMKSDEQGIGFGAFIVEEILEEDFM